MIEEFEGQTIGSGLSRRDWYSICSAHREYREGCPLCASGRYEYCIPDFFASAIYRYFPNLWAWWANRPGGSTQKRLEGWFQNLKRGE